MLMIILINEADPSYILSPLNHPPSQRLRPPTIVSCGSRFSHQQSPKWLMDKLAHLGGLDVPEMQESGMQLPLHLINTTINSSMKGGEQSQCWHMKIDEEMCFIQGNHPSNRITEATTNRQMESLNRERRTNYWVAEWGGKRTTKAQHKPARVMGSCTVMLWCL